MPVATARSPRLVVFDWDGTLMDSIGTIVECTMVACADVAGAVAPPPETVRQAIGLGLNESMQRFFPDGDPALYAAIVEAYRRRWRSDFKDQVALLDGAEATVRELKASGYRLGVATAKGRVGLERELAMTGLGELFDATRTADEAPSKPAPGMLLQLFEELEVEATAALMVGDTLWDLEMARAAGCAGVGVLTGGHSREQLATGDPVACLASVAELPAWLSE